LRRDLGGYGRDACYLPEAPSRNDLRGAGDGTQVDRALARRAFDADRGDLKAFVHDVYVEYLAFALSRNYVTFGFLQLLAFVLLMEDHDLREAVGFEYVMIDEFQDTSELQFKLALLLADAGNLCVVGDWKQSIYGFQYAAVENIRHFEERLSRFAAELNGDGTPGDCLARVDFPVDDVTEIALERNYRATQDLLDFSEEALTVEATNRETVDGAAIREEITGLTSATAHEESRIEAFAGPTDEYAAIFERIGEIVGNEAYAVTDEETGETRPPTLADITVLTRTRDFGREFQRRAAAYDLPVAYEGEVELLTTDQALLVLAWLRILEGVRADRGWAVVLERAGYTLSEVEHLLEYDHEEYDRIPDDLAAFRASLAALESVVGVARRVLDRYGFDDAYADGVIELLDEVVSDTRLTRGDVIRFLEAGIDAGATYPVSDSPGQDSVTVQTIHATKGLEHSIVIVANMNRYRFPPTGGSRDRIRFDDPIGLRQSKVYAEAHGQPHLYDNWRYDVLSACLRGQYDEERRLLYVAMTRAKHHLLVAAGEEPSPLFENLPLDPDVITEPTVEPFETGQPEQTRLEVRIPEIDAPAGYSAHDLMDESVFEGGVGE
ncbi:MAG: 3'-5' exonuclease, partial [Halodesulfurarchaeum sp.]